METDQMTILEAKFALLRQLSDIGRIGEVATLEDIRQQFRKLSNTAASYAELIIEKETS